MQDSGEANKATHEIGRIYDAITDKKTLIDFFLQTVRQFIPARRGYLFLAGANKKIWLENTSADSPEPSERLIGEAHKAFDNGKPHAEGKVLFLPLIVRNNALGVACFERGEKEPAFTAREIETGFDLASEFSGALKGTLLFEENLKMERLAAVGQAMGMVIHEIKNIMQLARFADEFTRMGIKEKNEKLLGTGLKKMEKTLRELDGFIWEMLSLTKDYQLEPEGVDIPALLEELKSDLAEKAKGHQIVLDFQSEKNFPTVQGDGRSIYRALLNLVKNAFEAFQSKPDSPSENSRVNWASPGNPQSKDDGGQGKPDACVKIRARVLDDEKYELAVEDNASGMSEEVKARLFEAFFSTKGKYGTGLGLMVVSRTVKMHHGEVRVESQPGVGTQFILTLPRAFTQQK